MASRSDCTRAPRFALTAGYSVSSCRAIPATSLRSRSGSPSGAGPGSSEGEFINFLTIGDLEQSVVELAGRAGDDVGPPRHLTDLEVVFVAGEDASVVPTHLLTRVGAGTWPATTVVGAFKPVPDPLAGPVVAAAVVFPPNTELDGIDDSKQLEPEERTKLASTIREHAAAIGIGSADVGEIDRLNIYHAALLAMRRAVEALPCVPEHVLVDARVIPGVSLSFGGG